jgi:hypothetical protein
MQRFGLFLILVLLFVPLVRDCCLPVTHNLPCHESKPINDVACASISQAITEGKGSVTVAPSADSRISPTTFGELCHPCGMTTAMDKIPFVDTTATDLYLRTGALLI